MLLIALTLPAQAQNGIAIETFFPLPDQEHNTLSTLGADTLGHLRFTTGGFFHTAFDTVAFLPSNEDLEPVNMVDTTYGLDLWMGMGFTDYVEVGMVLPVVLSTRFQSLPNLNFFPNNEDSSTLGDLRLSIKGRPWLRDDFDGFGLGFALIAHLPTTSREIFGGPTGSRIELKAVFDYLHSSGYSGAVNLGVMIVPEAGEFLSVIQDDSLTWSLSARGPIPYLPDSIELMASAFGTIQLWQNRDLRNLTQPSEDLLSSPAELQLALRHTESYGLYFHIGVGAGLNSALGAPSARLLASIGFTDLFTDEDEDGFADYEEACPGEQEDFDNFEDFDGCPEPDNDQDGILDTVDSCPNQPEDPDGFEDEDGCPDHDNDGDGFLDANDTCPNEAEDPDGFEDEDGCPDIDHDGDGIGEDRDNCPLQAEDPDGFEDEDGCPELDNDGDGIADAQDTCPNRPEDLDRFQDTDGCPDVDNDGDGFCDPRITDASCQGRDLCPLDAEIINGIEDEDGCPDTGDSFVSVTPDGIGLLRPITFRKAKLQKSSGPVLDQVATALAHHPALTQLALVVSASSAELASNRAKAIQNALEERGVSPERLVATSQVGEDAIYLLRVLGPSSEP